MAEDADEVYENDSQIARNIPLSSSGQTMGELDRTDHILATLNCSNIAADNAAMYTS